MYYDSQDIIDKANIASHGLEIVSGKNELESWIKKIYETSKTKRFLIKKFCFSDITIDYLNWFKDQK